MTQFGKASSIQYGSARSSSIQRTADAEFVDQTTRKNQTTPVEPSETKEGLPVAQDEPKRSALMVPMGDLLKRSLAGENADKAGQRKGTSGLGFILNGR